MKDTEARKGIEDLRDEIFVARNNTEGLAKRINGLEGKQDLAIRYCKKCNHDTVQQWRSDRFTTASTMAVYRSPDGTEEAHHLCLNCGTKWQCETKEICTELK